MIFFLTYVLTKQDKPTSVHSFNFFFHIVDLLIIARLSLFSAQTSFFLEQPHICESYYKAEKGVVLILHLDKILGKNFTLKSEENEQLVLLH